MRLFKTYSSRIYVLSMVAGIPPVFLGVFHDAGLAGAYLVLGAVFCYFWPKEGWKWGIYLGLPIFTVLAFSILFAGVGGDILYDLKMMIMPGLAAAAGALICQLTFAPAKLKN